MRRWTWKLLLGLWKLLLGLGMVQLATVPPQSNNQNQVKMSSPQTKKTTPDLWEMSLPELMPFTDVTRPPATMPPTTIAQFVAPTRTPVTAAARPSRSRQVVAPVGPASCIARYESEHGRTSSNIYQFQQGTWRAYGGVGTPGGASRAEQDAVFNRAWADAGPQHWAAQRGRCF